MTSSHTAPHSRLAGLLPFLSWLTAIASCAVIAVLSLYIRHNDSNHTGFEPWLLSIFFIPTAIVGLTALLRRNSRWGALLACIIGLGGMIFLYYIDHYNIMVQYDRLAGRGGL